MGNLFMGRSGRCDLLQARVLLSLTIISFLLTDAFNIISLDSVNNYYRSV